MRLVCEECAYASNLGYGWIAKVVVDEEFEVDPFLVFYCPMCAERKFNFISHHRPDDEFE